MNFEEAIEKFEQLCNEREFLERSVLSINDENKSEYNIDYINAKIDDLNKEITDVRHKMANLRGL